MRVRPTDPNRPVYYPNTPRARRLPESGASVPRTNYWLRRLKEGVIERVDQGEPAPQPSPAEPEGGAPASPKRRRPRTSSTSQTTDES